MTAACDFAPNPGHNTDGPFASDSARVPGGFGVVVGDLYHDRNNNGSVDEGETVGKTRLVLQDREFGGDVAETVSNAQGHVRFDRVPAGEFWARVDGPWKFKEGHGRLRVSADVEYRYGFAVVPVVPAEQPQPGGGGNTPPPAPAGGGSGDVLAKTGASVLGIALLGGLLVAFGIGASAAARRRSA